jgi:N-acyl-D-amino-acid deacylase
VKKEMSSAADKWENLYYLAGSPENVLLVGFKNSKLKPFTGQTLAEVARLRNSSAEDTAMDLVVEDGSRVSVVYHLMSEENVRREIKQPWMSFGSDAASLAPEGVFLKSSTHPRAYGNFARLLGKYVREEQLISLPEAIRRLSTLPARNLRLDKRGSLQPGFFADVVVFDPQKIADHATFADPQQYATGVVHVFVNGTPVLSNGHHTGAKPGRVVRRGR